MRSRFTEAAGLAVVNAKIAALVAPLPRCECCWELRHVTRDTYGGVMLVCARCDYQLRATGQCHLHHSKLLYPELAQPAAVPTPPEIEALFYVAERPKPDSVTPDAPGVLADVDLG